MEKLSFAYGCGGAFCRRAAGIGLYQAAPSRPCNVFLLKPVLAFADFEYDFGRGWAVFETVGVTPSDFDDRFTVPHTRPALQQQVHTALRDAAAVSAVRPLQQGGCGRKPAVLIVFECLIVEVLCGFDGMCGCAAAFGIEVMLFQFAVVEFLDVCPAGRVCFCVFQCFDFPV